MEVVNKKQEKDDEKKTRQIILNIEEGKPINIGLNGEFDFMEIMQAGDILYKDGLNRWVLWATQHILGLEASLGDKKS